MDIKFYKNNELIEIDQNSVIFFEDDFIIQKETDDNIIILDFKNKKCMFKLKNENIEFEIPVISMEHNEIGVKSIEFIYVLETEPDKINKILICIKS
jgi:hypothetical protein